MQCLKLCRYLCLKPVIFFLQLLKPTHKCSRINVHNRLTGFNSIFSLCQLLQNISSVCVIFCPYLTFRYLTKLSCDKVLKSFILFTHKPENSFHLTLQPTPHTTGIGTRSQPMQHIMTLAYWQVVWKCKMEPEVYEVEREANSWYTTKVVRTSSITELRMGFLFLYFYRYFVHIWMEQTHTHSHTPWQLCSKAYLAFLWCLLNWFDCMSQMFVLFLTDEAD